MGFEATVKGFATLGATYSDRCMSFRDVVAQPQAVSLLSSAIAHDRVGHAYLFHGPDGTGKRMLALRFAQALLCEEGGSDACGACRSCKNVHRLIHPDVHVLFPYPNDTDESDVMERRKRMAADPYAVLDFVRKPTLSGTAKVSNKQSTFTVERVHEELRQPMSFRPVEGRYKVAILLDVELMRVEAANAFLKLLEEPPPRTVFLLCTSRPDRVLPTILSRCQRIRLHPLEPEAIAAYLVARQQQDSTSAALLAHLADGSLSRALELADSENVLEQRDRVTAFMRTCFQLNSTKYLLEAEEMAGWGRERLKGWLILMLRWIRDLVLYRELGDAAPLVNQDQRETIKRFVGGVPLADLEGMANLVEEAIRLVERNVSVATLLKVLAFRLHFAMRTGHVQPLYLPLAG